MMHMTFWLGFDIKDLLFENLNISSITGLILTCLCVFGIALFYESLKVCLAVVKLNAAVLKVPHRQQCFSDNMVLINGISRNDPKRHLWAFTEVLIYSVELVFGYIIMLLVMTYNVYLIVALLIATGFCYMVFGRHLTELKIKTSKLKIPCEHCSKHQHKDSSTSSTEIITDSIADCNERPCCSSSAIPDDCTS